MQEIIEKIYRGNLTSGQNSFYPAEQIEPMLQDFRRKWEKSKGNTEMFSAKLTDELKPLFEAVMVGKLEIAALEQTQAFVDGFKLGARLLVEVLSAAPVPEKE